MATLSQVKTYGGIGSILILLAPVPDVGWLLAISGFVLSLIAVKYISDIFKDASIFNNMVISIGTAVAGVLVGFFILLGAFFRFMGLNNLTIADFGSNFNPSTVPTGDWLGLILWAVAGLAAMWVLLTVSGVFFRRGYGKVATTLNIHLFATAGLLFLIGAATTIVLVGFILIPIAILLLAIAYFSIQDVVPGVQPTVQIR
ncbi:MAG TPA: DUF996 domain-containing protein [Nitrososphaerales archaeon]|nr:DUF996 domain-containing protein [Nitrososphaerales archaeon]